MIQNRKATDTTPEVSFEVDAEKVIFNGESYPENASQFFEPLIEEIKSHLEDANKLIVDFKLLYFNTSSSKYLFDLLADLEESSKQGKVIEIIWHYRKNVEVTLEHGEDFADEFDLPVELVGDL